MSYMSNMTPMTYMFLKEEKIFYKMVYCTFSYKMVSNTYFWSSQSLRIELET